MKLALIALHISVLFAAVALAALGTSTGRESELWTRGRYSVIVGTLQDVKQMEGAEDRPYVATLKPIGTLAGAFDPSLNSDLRVRFYVGHMVSSIKEPPGGGATVLAVIRTKILHGEETEPSDWIVSDLCTFMPGNAGLVEIEGLGDPRILETLRRLREARASGTGPAGDQKRVEKGGQ
jgi:hypothetical protein